MYASIRLVGHDDPASETDSKVFHTCLPNMGGPLLVLSRQALGPPGRSWRYAHGDVY